MTNLIEYHIPEAIQIRVTKVGTEPPVASPILDSKSKTFLLEKQVTIEVGQDVLALNSSILDRQTVTFCVDPQITSLSILQSLIIRAFNLHGDFLLFYEDGNNNVSSGKQISSEADLQAAFSSRSPALPFLSISLHIIDYSLTTANMSSSNSNSNLSKDQNEVWQASKKSSTTVSKTSGGGYMSLLADWDVVTNSDVILAQTLNATNTFLAKQIEKIKERALTTTANLNNSSGSYWYLAESIYQYIIAGEDRLPEPLDDAAFRAFQDSEGRIGSTRDLRIAVYRRGVEPSLRRVIWKHLLNVYPEGYTGQERLDFLRLRCQTYRQMRDLWQNANASGGGDPEVAALVHMVRKDVFRTDRHHPFYANNNKGGAAALDPDREEDNPNVTALLNILITYALNHRIRYCQGMSDLASPLLYVMKDEAHGYVAFCALMSRLGENFSVDGIAMGRKFEHLAALLEHYDADFYRYLVAAGAHELLFAYRWLLLDLKREFPFEEMLEVLEVTWASIPPASGAYYRNLFDDGCLYTPGRSLSKAEDKSPPEGEKKVDEKEVADIQPKTKQSKKADNSRQLRSIKFLPNVLSSDSAVLDSPTSEDGSEEGDDKKVVPWDSPDCSSKRAAYAFEHPTLGSSKCAAVGTSFGSVNSEQQLYGNFISVGATFEEEDEEDHLAVKGRADSTSKTSQTGVEDNVSSCSTFDSGIQRSNTLSSMVQGSDESGCSTSNHKNKEDACDRRRQRFQCLSGLRNAHCNGDDDDGQFSEDDGLDIYDHDHSVEEEDDDHFQSRRGGGDYFSDHFGGKSFDGFSDDFSTSTTFKTGSVNSTRTLLPRTSVNSPLQKKAPFQPLLAKSLLIGESFGSFDAESKQESEINVKTLSKGNKSPLINIDDDDNSPVNEFEDMNSSGKMAKSVSEEMINNLEKEMSTLNVSNGDDLDNLSSSSTSSLVILSKKTTQNCQQPEKEAPKAPRLLSPEELGPNDAFMLFLCLTILLQSRDHIMGSRMDRNDIQMYFDGLIRKHSVRSVLGDARHLFHTYLSVWHKECLHK